MDSRNRLSSRVEKLMNSSGIQSDLSFSRFTFMEETQDLNLRHSTMDECKNDESIDSQIHNLRSVLDEQLSLIADLKIQNAQLSES